MRADARGLYVHIPFCLKKCNYCDFCSFSDLSDEVRQKYIERLLCEILEYKSEPKIQIDTIFFGGGTPSLLSEAEFRFITEKIGEVFDVSENCEFTVESNPKTLTREKLIAYKACGVNRLSIGLQSIHENEQKILGRIHNFDDFLESYRTTREVGIDNINVDIMYSIPSQTLESFEKTLDAVISLMPEHISAYSLILEEGTPLYQKQSELSLPTLDEECRMYDILCERMSTAGYRHYEISNYAKPGRECRHNLVYWRAMEYLGVGVAAHSCFGGVRFSNSEKLSEYLTENYKEYRTEEKIGNSEREYEYAMLALRLSEGIDLLEYRARFGKDFLEGKADVASSLAAHGLAYTKDGHFSLTKKGFYVSNEIICRLL